MLRKSICLVFVVLLVSLTNSALADWRGAVSSDWYDAANWSGAVPTSGETASIDSPTVLTWPIIDGGTADTGQLQIGYTATYQGELTVTGGATLNVNGELRIGRKSNDGSGQAVGILHISGATTTINVTELIEHGRHGHATIYMSGGYLHCDAELRMAYRFDATSTVYLSGGTIDLGGNPGITVYANDGVPDTALIDISGGTLTLAGNQVSMIETFISEGIIIGYGGEGTVSVTFDGATNTTMVVGIGGPSTSEPDPVDGKTDVPRDVVLGWKTGTGADKHDVYFGDNFDNVNQATTTVDPSGVYQGRIDPNIYTHTERLEFGRIYYWRIDEVEADGTTIHKGDVWSFTAELFAYAIENIIAEASSSEEGKGPENTVNGSGLDDSGLLHSNEGVNAMWLSSRDGTQPTWIEYEFERAYKLHKMWVWNSNDSLEPLVGFGFKDVTIEYSVNGTDYATLGTAHEFAQGPGASGYAYNTTVDFGGVAAKYVRLTANSNWGGIFNQYGFSEVRFFHIPVSAREPSPDSGATDVDVNVTLGWQAGREAARHNVYLSTDEQAVIDGNAPVNTVTDASYSPLPLDLGRTYYWRIDEVNETETPTTWQGDIWNLSTQEYRVVDDFESYNEIPAGEEGSNLVYLAWIDGFDNPSVNGSTMGHAVAFEPSMESVTVYDGKQSAPLYYDNTTAGYSEATVNVANLQVGQDWAKHGIKALTLHFFGDPNNNVQQMYVKINGSKVTYDGEAENLKRIGWQMWYIDLTSTGVSLSNVTELSIGLERIGAVGGQGVVYLDGIRLYAHDRQVITPADPGTTGLQAHYEFEGNTNDSSGNARHGVGTGNPTFVAGKVGQAVHLRGLDYVVITGYKGILGANPFSISAWIKTSLPEEQQIVYYGTNVNGQRCEFRVDDTGDVRIGVGGGQVTSLTTVNDGGWHHVLVTISENATNSSSDLRVYVDGQDDTEESTDLDPLFDIVADLDVTIGYRPSQNDRGFQGELDDVRIYDRVLSPEEAAWLAGRTKPFDKPF